MRQLQLPVKIRVAHGTLSKSEHSQIRPRIRIGIKSLTIFIINDLNLYDYISVFLDNNLITYFYVVLYLT